MLIVLGGSVLWLFLAWVVALLMIPFNWITFQRRIHGIHKLHSFQVGGHRESGEKCAAIAEPCQIAALILLRPCEAKTALRHPRNNLLENREMSLEDRLRLSVENGGKDVRPAYLRDFF